ncbi:MAG TPA: DUF4129 domain-containing protein [Thermoanaerobaculia bacterium]|nr:DUF4129 domain-containing protein [Thermoanaerobaculia bacterium]
MKRLLAALVLLALVSTLRAETIPLQRYIESLDALRHEAPAVRASQARLLIGTAVASPNGTFLADASLLHAVAAGGADAIPRLDATIAALRSVAPASAASADIAAIERLRKMEEAAAMRRGGEVGSATAPTNDDAVERWTTAVTKVLTWIGQKLQDFYDWVMSWWPRTRRPDEERSGFGAVPFVVIAIVIAIVGLLTLLAVEVMRRSKRGERAPLIVSDPQASRRDEDPLSRGANEWERYAAQLAAAGRIREAIRAWYHAVLVTLYAAGILHFRKGRTNWEYIALLAPELPWRGGFVQLTRRFEEEWYGHEESAIETLDDCSARAKEILANLRRGVAA